ncbi:MAG: hypothetical protein KW793_03380 [Candidatus Doudnabacteria bacterium]|nr:hypothetical protein [Candidatus Doudnabacteria bacterium]
MIIVHDLFVCKPGNASKLAKLFKEAMAGYPEVKHILTDVTGQYNRVIMVTEYENLTAYEQSFEKYRNPTPEMKAQEDKMKNYTEMYQTGGREIYRVM